MKVKATICINAPKEEVWQVLSDVAAIHLWVAAIESAHCEGEQKRGVGTVRVCRLKGGNTIKERWIAWEEGHSFTYQAAKIALLKSAMNQWSVEAVDGKTLLTSEATVQLRGGVFSRLLEPLVYVWSKRLGAESLASLKYLVETGRPFTGKLSDLPAFSTTC